MGTVVVTGGVMSGVGKGLAAASMASLLAMRGLTVSIIKCDPYYCVNAGLMNPTQHGEVYVCDDGTEADMDLLWYSMVAGLEVSAKNICTAGALYSELLDRQVKGGYLGQTVQLVPHLTDLVLERLEKAGADADILIVEIGGTVGDMESGFFFEAVRQLRHSDYGHKVASVHVAPVLWVNAVEEFKTKPLQASVYELRRLGIEPDILLCRVDRPVDEAVLDKVSKMAGVRRHMVFDAPDVPTPYEVLLELYARHVDDMLADKLGLPRRGVRVHKWRECVEGLRDATLPVVTVGVVGKYKHKDAYLSLKEAVLHAAVAAGCRPDIRWVDAEAVEKDTGVLAGLDAVIVPGGFDTRGVEGKVRAAGHARANKIPFLGICLGLQCAVIEFARNACGIADATSQEFGVGTHVIHEVPLDKPGGRMSGTLRLGSFPCVLTKGSLAHETYRKRTVAERHRHRYEVNADHVGRLVDAGLVVSGVNPESGLVEVVELDRAVHPYFVASQGHPEFNSRLGQPNPLFAGLLGAARKIKEAGGG